MKNALLILFLLLGKLTLFSQIITSTPQFPTEEDEITIVFDASKGTGGLKGNAGPIYAHIGLITDKSTSSSDWKYVLTPWPNSTNQALANTEANKLTSLGNNRWQLVIKPDVRQLFGVPAGEAINTMMLVFRNASGTAEGKDTGGKDIELSIYQKGLNVSFSAPNDSVMIVSKGFTQTIVGNSSASASLTLSVNGVDVSSKDNAASISYTYTFDTAGNHEVKLSAVAGGLTASKSIIVCVRADVENQTCPSGWTDGINIIDKSTTGFKLYAPGKQYIYMLGDFNDWTPDNSYMMKKDGDYYWLQINNLKENTEYAFQYLVDGSIRAGDMYCEKILDPWSDKYINQEYDVYPGLKAYPDGKTSDLVSVFKTQRDLYKWNVNDFKTPSGDALNIYEMHFRDFTTQGTVRAAISKLDYIAALGVTAVELMPIQEFDGNDSWGYNPNFYFAPDKAYGTPSDYKDFVDECHKRGMAVILDVVFNHSWGQNPMIKMWQNADGNPSADSPYAFTIAHHPYNVGYDLKHESATRAYFERVLKFWIEEYRIDGFRFDLSKGITLTDYGTSDVNGWSGYDAGRIEILKGYHSAIKEASADAITILEHLGGTLEERELAEAGMYLWRNMNYNYGQAMMGWSNGSSFDGMYTSSSSMPGCSLVGYMESHDEERLFFKASDSGDSYIKNSFTRQIAQAKLNSLFTFLVPGPKMIWQFGELGYDYSIDYNDRTGRKPVKWEYLDDPDRKELHDFYALLMSFRKHNQELFGKDARLSWSVNDATLSNGRRLELSCGDTRIIVIANFSGYSKSISPNLGSTGIWYNPFTGDPVNITDASAAVNVGAGEYMIYSTKDLSTGIDDIYSSDNVGIANIFNNAIILNSSAIEMSLYTLDGRIVRSVANSAVMDVEDVVSGYYLLKIFTGEKTFTEKLFKK